MYPNIERKETGPKCMDKTAGDDGFEEMAIQFATRQVIGENPDLMVRVFSEFVACVDANQAAELATLLMAKDPATIVAARNRIVDAYLADRDTQKAIDNQFEIYCRA